MSGRNRWGVAACAALALLAPPLYADESSAERQSVEEIRDTVINLLQALVDKGLITRQQAEQMVKQAQSKAAADAAARAAQNAAQAKEEQNAVRVPYVPQIVKDEISKQVAQEVKPEVVADVVKEAKSEKWGVPAALPDWLSRVRVFGDVTVRAQADLFPPDNSYQQLLDYNAVNTAGGIALASYPFLNTTDDRYRIRLRARLGAEGDISDYVKAYIRLASGSLTQVAGSESQTLGTYGNRYTVGIDQAYIAWNTNVTGKLSMNSIEAGRIGNPWFAPTELVYARDLTFEGIADTVRAGWGPGGEDRSHVYLTLGAFPMLEVPLQAQQDKWMLGAQIGTNLRLGEGSDYFRLGAAYYDFLKVTGVKNQPYSTLLNYTAPPFVQWGNTMYDISNVPNSDVNLFGLAAHFRIADLAATYEHDFHRYSLAFLAEADRNIGYDLTDIESLTQQAIASPQNKGYVGEVNFGDPIVNRFGLWRVAVGYRYVQADAVLDAWTDADFHGGGTNALGYYVWASYGVARNTWLRLRYLSGDEITGPRYGLDIWQLDVNAQF